MKRVVLLEMTADELSELVERSVDRALARRRDVKPAPPKAQARLTAAEAAELLRCSVRTVKRLNAAGLLPGAKVTIGGSSRLLFKLADVEARLIAT